MWTRETKDRKGMWKVIREKKKCFTRYDIINRTGHCKASVIQYLDALIESGYVVALNKPKIDGRQEVQYKLIKDPGVNPPRIYRNGGSKPAGSNQRVWSAIKVLGRNRFDWRDVALAASAGDPRKYLDFLAKAGYLRAFPREPHKPTTYIFVKGMNTGPLAPLLRKWRKEVHDANTGEIMWMEGHVRVLVAKTGKVEWVKGGVHV